MKKHLLYILAALTALTATAYDFTAENSDGKTIYYNKMDGHRAEVTYSSRFTATGSYAGELRIPDTVVYNDTAYAVSAIGDFAFFNCRSLEGVKIPAGIEKIGTRAFAWCDAITTLTLPPALASIGANAFDGCYALTAIYATGDHGDNAGVLFADDMQRLVAYTPGTSGAYTVPEGTTAIGDNAFAACTFLESVQLPATLTSIGDNAFYFCGNLGEVHVPASVTHIGDSAFGDCANLQSIDVDDDNAAYSDYKGTLMDKARARLLQSPGSGGGLAVIPDGTADVGDRAFMRNLSLTTVQMPEGVKIVGNAAFIDCMHLTTVTLPESIEYVGDLAFAMNPSLRAIYCHHAVPDDIEMGVAVFAEVDHDSCTLYVPGEAVELYNKTAQWTEFRNILPIEGLKEQSILWPAAADTMAVADGSGIVLDATATSGLPVQYLLAPSCYHLAFLTDGGITILAPGKIILTAYQSGNGEYLPATPVTHVYTVASGVEDEMADAADVRVYTTPGRINIAGAAESDLAEVYDLGGTCLYRGTGRSVAAASGRIYIVRIAGRAYKVAVR